MLPTQPSTPKTKLEDYTILLYGSPKIGKSTFASQFPKPLFLSTEPGLNALSVYEKPIHDWTSFLSVCAVIAEGKHDFKTIVIDTVDNLYKSCADYVLQKADVTHESDLDYGKGYALVRTEFSRAIRKLTMLPYGVIFISHTAREEIKTRTTVYHRNIPTLPKNIREALLAWVDIILFADITPEGKRVLRTKTDERYLSGDRTISIFGKPLPDELSLEFSKFSEEFYNRKGGK